MCMVMQWACIRLSTLLGQDMSDVCEYIVNIEVSSWPQLAVLACACAGPFFLTFMYAFADFACAPRGIAVVSYAIG